MSEPIAASISIGGKLPKRLVAPLCQAIAAAGVAMEWGDAPFRPKTAQDLLGACRQEWGTSVLWLCDDWANWGRFPALEAFLVERARLPFDLRSEGKAEFDPELIVFRPGRKPVSISTLANGKPIVTVDRLTPIVQRLAKLLRSRPFSQAKARRTLKRLHAALPVLSRPLTPSEIG
jgi:hypothetical protein